MGNLCCSALNPNASDKPPAHCVPPEPKPKGTTGGKENFKPKPEQQHVQANPKAAPEVQKKESLAEKLKREGVEKSVKIEATPVELEAGIKQKAAEEKLRVDESANRAQLLAAAEGKKKAEQEDEARRMREIEAATQDAAALESADRAKK
mmetsp:Transcript_94362/g.137746  ORF Transcript_94362/g.137746 Transcript_94362/m.137746 type:complete len:150 (-) Transcript_94362:436-885(-)